MTRFKASICYDGTRYLGFQVQPQSPTIQEVIEENLYQILRERIRVIPSGRTDAGVHALNQILHFDLHENESVKRAQTNKFLHSLNQISPKDIAFLSCAPCEDDFHARKSAKAKTYAYWIIQSPVHDVFFQNKAWHLPKALDVTAMQEASQHLLGEHDFSAFCASDSNAENKIRTLHKIDFSFETLSDFLAHPQQSLFKITFTGSGFLKQMVRNLVGTLVDIGRHKTATNAVTQILQSRNRQKAGQTAPAHGLYLVNVDYE